MSVDERLLADIRANIGVTQRTDLGEITALHIRRYALAVGEENPLHTDAEHARSLGYPDVVAPPNMLPSVIEWGVGHPEAELNTDGTTGEHLYGVDTSSVRTMGGGETMTFHRLVVAGSRVTQTTTLTDATLREARTGPMIIVGYRNQYHDEHGTELMTCDRTMLLR
ncbi:MAG TPA: MaoC family dehydratase N-terminal domain-containing protein [Streptosporangiaceae bacterium]|jgi:acyl dehydratase